MADERIIVIEDDPDIAWLVQVRLEDAGYRGEGASDGAAGLDAFMVSGADLVLLDVNLPVMSGLEVFTRLRAQSAVPVMVMTAYGCDQEQIGFAGLDPVGYVAKPFSPRELVARISKVFHV